MPEIGGKFHMNPGYCFYFLLKYENFRDISA